MMHFPINMSGVEDSVENYMYQSYLAACCAVMAFESYEIHIFFSFCHSGLDLSHGFHAQIYFHSHHLLLAVENV